jgi:hypothetical protein
MLLDFFLTIFGCMAENSVNLEPLVYVYMALSVFCWVLRACLLGFPYLRDLSYLAICTKRYCASKCTLRNAFSNICIVNLWNRNMNCIFNTVFFFIKQVVSKNFLRELPLDPQMISHIIIRGRRTAKLLGRKDIDKLLQMQLHWRSWRMTVRTAVSSQPGRYKYIV